MKVEKYPIKRATKQSAGYDLAVMEAITLHPGEWVRIDTGVAFEDNDLVRSHDGKLLKDGWFMAVFPRSSMGMNFGLRFSNTVGIIDCDFRKTIKLDVTVDKECYLKEGERIAQGIILPYFTLADEIEPVEERKGGIGSTGRI